MSELDPHPRLRALLEQARQRVAGASVPLVALVHPCDRLALEVAAQMAATGLARPLLIGARDLILRAADDSELSIADFEIVPTGPAAPEAAQQATHLARQGVVGALMKGSLHTDELMSAVVNKESGLRTERRISHAFVFDLPRYHKLLAMADCVVNIHPDLRTKRDILSNALELLQQIGIQRPKVGIVSAVETVNPAIARQLHQLLARDGAWPGALIEGPFGFDNVISAEAARIKKIESQVAGDADLLLVPDLNAGNMLYKSFNYIGGGDCAGLVLGARVPIVLTSRADSVQSRLASVALAVLAKPSH